MFSLGRISLSSRVWRPALVAVLAFSIGSASVAFGLVIGGVVFACYHNATGVLRLELAEKQCNTAATNPLLRETRISWNQVGQQGVQGIQGPKGDQGIQGLKGDQGIQGVQGEKGDEGDKGDAGTEGAPGQGVEVTQLPVGSSACPTGGIQVVSAAGTHYVCNGAQGPAAATLPQITSFSAQPFLVSPGIYTITVEGRFSFGVGMIESGANFALSDTGTTTVRYVDRLVIDGPTTKTYALSVRDFLLGPVTDSVETTISVCQAGCEVAPR